MAAPNANLQQMMMDKAVDMSLDMTAQITGLPKETVTKVVRAGLPMMAKMADENPELFKTMYSQSVKMLPEPMQTFYAKLAENPQAQLAMVDEFKMMYGPMLEAVNREAAGQAGVSADQAGQVLATTHPAVAHAMGKATEGTGETGLRSWLQGLGRA